MLNGHLDFVGERLLYFCEKTPWHKLLHPSIYVPLLLLGSENARPP